MKQTEHFNLPLIELEDNYDIEVFNDGNKITDTQLKALKDMADSWIAFKNTGGEIGGDLKYKYARVQGLIGDLEGNEMFIQAKAFHPNNHNETTLGKELQAFKDIYLSGVSKGPTGYNKESNGIIKQWVERYVEVTATEITITVQLPITYPTGTLYSFCNIRDVNGSNNNSYKNRFVINAAHISNNTVRVDIRCLDNEGMWGLVFELYSSGY